MEEAMYATLDREYIEHDAFELFTSIMRSAKPFYEWRQEAGPVSTCSCITKQRGVHRVALDLEVECSS